MIKMECVCWRVKRIGLDFAWCWECNSSSISPRSKGTIKIRRILGGKKI